MKPIRLALYALLVAPLIAVRPASAQVVNDHSNRWYWGAQAGGFLFQTNGQGYAFDPVFGAHWLITAKRTALYIGGEQAFLLADALSSVGDQNSVTGIRDATFSQVRRLFVGLLAFPLQRRIEPYAGGGFAIVTVQNAVVDCSNTTPNSQCATANDQIAAQSLVDPRPQAVEIISVGTSHACAAPRAKSHRNTAVASAPRRAQLPHRGRATPALCERTQRASRRAHRGSR